MDWLSEIFGTENGWMAILLILINTDRLRDRPQPERWSCTRRRHRLAIKNFRDREFLGSDSDDSCKKMVACSIGPSPNDGHAHGGDMDWLSKLVGAENFWMAILLIPINTDCVQGRSKPERWSCPRRRHGLAIKTFRDRNSFDGDYVDSYKNCSLASSAPKPNDSHARGGGIDWLSKVFGAEEAWMAILLTPRKTDRFQDRPTPE